MIFVSIELQFSVWAIWVDVVAVNESQRFLFNRILTCFIQKRGKVGGEGEG